MVRHRRWATPVLMAVIAGLGMGACGDGGDAVTTAPRVTPTAGEVPLAGLPPETAGFDGWLRLNDRPIRAAPDTPHGGDKRVYVNRPAAQVVAGDRLRLPLAPGTVLLKTGARAGDPEAFVSVMVKVPDADPQHGDWVFTEYARPDRDDPYTILAQDSACWGCHAGAIATDWVFTAPE